MAGFSVRVDSGSLLNIEQALKSLPTELKSKAIEQAQVRAAGILRSEAKSRGNQLGGSGSWAKAQHVVRGKDKKYSPYVVVKTANKRFSIKPRAPHMDDAGATVANPVKYNHLLQQGSKGGVRTGGLGSRLGALGQRKMKATGRGGFMVRSQQGYIHRISQIRHPGYKGEDIYGQVLESKGDAAAERFNQDAIKVIEKFKAKKGFK